MRQPSATEQGTYPGKTTTKKDFGIPLAVLAAVPDSLVAWQARYLQLAVSGVCSPAVYDKIALHLARFHEFVSASYGHDRLSTVLPRDVLAWRGSLLDQGLAPATVNNHLASVSAFTTWVHRQAPNLFSLGDPTKGIGDLALPPLEPRALSPEQVRSLKNLCDRLPRLRERHGRRAPRVEYRIPVRADSRPYRDRAIVFVLLSTGLRREELVQLDLDQVDPANPLVLQQARRAQLRRVRGKGKAERTVFLSADARQALAEYLVRERPEDAGPMSTALFLSAHNRGVRAAHGRLSVRAINLILEQIGRWHDADVKDPARRISPLRPHDLRHTFAFQLAQATKADAYELERRLGHRSQRYIQRYTNPPEKVAAGYIEEF